MTDQELIQLLHEKPPGEFTPFEMDALDCGLPPEASAKVRPPASPAAGEKKEPSA